MFLNTVHLFIDYASDPRLSYGASGFFPVDLHSVCISVCWYFVWLQMGTLVDQTSRRFTLMFSPGWCFQIFLVPHSAAKSHCSPCLIQSRIWNLLGLEAWDPPYQERLIITVTSPQWKSTFQVSPSPRLYGQHLNHLSESSQSQSS